ncbi:MAG: hypothetical protein Q4B70_13265 [Lachnospiraceae bacterium]|nr:hypothetical protein [Lachnospiraceae bacterium]
MKGLKLFAAVFLVFVMMTGCSNGTTENTTAKEGQSTNVQSAEDTSSGDVQDENTQEEESQNGEVSADDSSSGNAEAVGGWKIEVEDSNQGKELSDVSVVLGYTGTGTEEYSKEAEEGKEFLLVKLLCEKEDGQEVIDWEQLTVTDSEGNEYKRIDDAFLTDLNMKRMPGTELNFGSNEGFIAFEVNEGASGYTLSYPFEEGNIEIQF